MTCYRMSGCGVEPIKSAGRARGRRTVRVCGPATIPARGLLEPAPGFSESGCGVEPITSVGRARGQRTVRVCGPATIPGRGPVNQCLDFPNRAVKKR